MTTSLNNPRLDFKVNALETFNLLEAIRKYGPETAVLFSSTNKVCGDWDILNMWKKKQDTLSQIIQIDLMKAYVWIFINLMNAQRE
jgi:CDP-paratose 2-epimerase